MFTALLPNCRTVLGFVLRFEETRSIKCIIFLFVPGSWDLHRNFFAVFFTQDAGCTETEGHARLLQGRESWFVFATSWQVWSSLNIAQICALKPHDFHLHWKLVLCLFEKWVALNHPKSIGQSSFPCIENAIWGVYHGYIMVYGTIPNLTQPTPMDFLRHARP